MVIIKTAAPPSLKQLIHFGLQVRLAYSADIMNDPVIKGLSETLSGQVPPLNIFIHSAEGLKPQVASLTFFYSLGKDSFFQCKIQSSNRHGATTPGTKTSLIYACWQQVTEQDT